MMPPLDQRREHAFLSACGIFRAHASNTISVSMVAAHGRSEADCRDERSGSVKFQDCRFDWRHAKVVFHGIVDRFYCYTPASLTSPASCAPPPAPILIGQRPGRLLPLAAPIWASMPLAHRPALLRQDMIRFYLMSHDEYIAVSPPRVDSRRAAEVYFAGTPTPGNVSQRARDFRASRDCRACRF